jgi:hypothetical protein
MSQGIAVSLRKGINPATKDHAFDSFSGRKVRFVPLDDFQVLYME